MSFASTCLPCRAGWHALCSGEHEGRTCCCDGGYSLAEHLHELEVDEATARGQLQAAETLGAAAEGGSRRGGSRVPDAAPAGAPQESVPAEAGDSGYIDRDAWASTAKIGTLTDPRSTGRKRAARMYPIAPGTVCEWARKKNCGGGPEPILGCMGNPATDWHHGPDKNTLNNAKKSRGIGATENLHLVCSDCHNSWHGANDRFYPPYDRVADQDKAWLPYTTQPWGPQEPSPASIEELLEQEEERERQRAKRGREHRGRNAAGRPGDVTVRDDDADDD